MLGLDDLELDDSIGMAGQVGADWRLNERWLINVDVRDIDIDTDVKLTVIVDSVEPAESVRADIGTVGIGPWGHSINVGFTF